MAYQKMGPRRRFFDVIVAKAAFHLKPGKMTPLSVMPGLTMADQYADPTADVLHLLKAGDLVLSKPGTDVIVTGNAQRRSRQITWHAALQFYAKNDDTLLLKHELKLFGARQWYWDPQSEKWLLTEPETTDSVPLLHEYAFGGGFVDEQGGARLAPNPAGRGVAVNMQPNVDLTAHQIERADWPITELLPATPILDYPLCSMTPVSRTWPARLQFAGTYDEQWLSENTHAAIMDLPSDFNERFYQCANPSLITPTWLQGDERVTLTGLLRDFPDLSTALPNVHIDATITQGALANRLGMVLDTILIDLDSRVVNLTWRARVASNGDAVRVDIHEREMR